VFQKSSGWLNGEFSIRAPRYCKDCGAVFEPPSSKAISSFVLLFGLAMIIVPMFDFVQSMTQPSWARFLFRGFSALCCLLFGLQLISSGIAAIKQQGCRIITTGKLHSVR
jgi:uncharacterized protein (DUF983 family)